MAIFFWDIDGGKYASCRVDQTSKHSDNDLTGKWFTYMQGGERVDNDIDHYEFRRDGNEYTVNRDKDDRD
jgi:hypothetical protein